MRGPPMLRFIPPVVLVLIFGAGLACGADRPRDLRVLFITSKDSERCALELARLQSAGGDFEKLRQSGWKIGDGPENHLQIVEAENLPDGIGDLEVREYPAVVCLDHGQVVRSYQAGCTTPLDVWTFGFLAKGTNERPA